MTDVGAFEYQPGGSGGAPGSGGTGAGTGGAAEQSCTSGLTLCGTVCVDLATDAANCGDCGVVCPEGQFCSSGTCATTCADGLIACGQSCVDLMSNVLHCGACNAACDGGQECVNGECVGTSTGNPLTEPVDTSESESTDEESGCGCVTTGSSQRGVPVGVGLVGLLASLLIRRRRRSPNA